MAKQQKRLIDFFLGGGGRKRPSSVLEGCVESEEENDEMVMTFENMNEIRGSAEEAEIIQMKNTQNESQKSTVSNMSAQTAKSFWSATLGQAPPGFSSTVFIAEEPKEFLKIWYGKGLGALSPGTKIGITLTAAVWSNTNSDHTGRLANFIKLTHHFITPEQLLKLQYLQPSFESCVASESIENKSSREERNKAVPLLIINHEKNIRKIIQLLFNAMLSFLNMKESEVSNVKKRNREHTVGSVGDRWKEIEYKIPTIEEKLKVLAQAAVIGNADVRIGVASKKGKKAKLHNNRNKNVNSSGNMATVVPVIV